MSFFSFIAMVAASGFLVTAIWLQLATRRHWLDHPNFRSSHERPTPKSGGIGFVASFLGGLVYLFLQHELSGAETLLFAGSLILAVLGLVDDMRGLGIRSRLTFQFLAVLTLWPFLLRLPPLTIGSAFSVEEWGLVVLTIIALLWLVNLYNFMDGIDALAATEAIFFCLAIAGFAGIKGERVIVEVVLCLAAAITGFLYFNLPTAKVFMGDLGSNFLGLTVGVVGLWAVQVGALHYWAVLLLLGTFVVDSTTTLLGRMLSGAVWYHPHRTHGYQKAASLMKSHGKVVVINTTINLVWLTPMAILVQRMPQWGALFTVAGFLPLAGVILYLRKDKERIT